MVREGLNKSTNNILDNNSDTYLAHLQTPLTHRVGALENINQLEETSKIIQWDLPGSTSSTKWKRRSIKRAQRRVEIKKEMEELHKAISNRYLDTEKINTAVFDSGAR